MRAKKSLGQNFLVDEGVVERIVRAFEPRADETVIEIGPGQGALTSRLLEMAGRVVAVEFDTDLAPLLHEKFGGAVNFTLIEGDALQVNLCEAIAPAASARLVANLPYYISTAILQRILEQRACLSHAILMLQREVVERITAPPATSERGFLTVLVEAYAEVEKLFDVAPTAFRPVPKVWSTVISLGLRPHPAIEIRDEKLFRQLVSAGFAQKRKTIFNNLRHAPENLLRRIIEIGGAALLLERARIEPQRRAETLTLDEWSHLSNLLS